MKNNFDFPAIKFADKDDKIENEVTAVEQPNILAAEQKPVQPNFILSNNSEHTQAEVTQPAPAPSSTYTTTYNYGQGAQHGASQPSMAEDVNVQPNTTTQGTNQDSRYYHAADQQQAASGGGNAGQIPPSGRANYQQMQQPKKEKKGLWKTFFISMSGALAGCLLFFGIAQGPSWINSIVNPINNGSTSSSAQLPKTNTSTTNLASVVEAVSPGVVTVLVNVEQQNLFGRSEIVQGLGSGVVYHVADGKVYIVTNAHVVQDAKEIAVYRNDLSRDQLDVAKVVDMDVDSDIAVILLEKPKQAYERTIDFGNSNELVIGQEVIAVGSPMGEEFSGSVTRGIISGLNRKLSVDRWGDKFQSFIQTDAAINGGNSGGGLIDMNGRLIGINSAKIEADNIGLAIPSNTVLAILESMDVPMPDVDWEFENQNLVENQTT